LIIENIGEEDNIYFQEYDSILQKASRNFNSYVKSEIFKKVRNTKWVMDLASGKGQDLFRYSSNNMRNIIFLEINKVALAELISRKHSFTTNNKFRNHMNILIQNVDLFDNYKDIIEKINNVYTDKSIDLIMCMFAFHYLMKNMKSLKNICKLINYYLKQNGKFVFSAFDGQKIVDLLEENNGEWTINVDDDVKYSIKKKYDNNILEGIGQKIDVLLPFSKNTYYEEYLINIDIIEKELSKYNIILETNESFSNFFDSYNGHLNNDDKKYVDLYHYYIFTKK
jgi:ubiquinone/menaquinone biosynthesis C-methylase UbiE